MPSAKDGEKINRFPPIDRSSASNSRLLMGVGKLRAWASKTGDLVKIQLILRLCIEAQLYTIRLAIFALNFTKFQVGLGAHSAPRTL